MAHSPLVVPVVPVLPPELPDVLVVGAFSQVQAASLQTWPWFSQPSWAQSQLLPVLPEQLRQLKRGSWQCR